MVNNSPVNSKLRLPCMMTWPFLTVKGVKKDKKKKKLNIFLFIWWLKKIVSNEYLIDEHINQNKI